MARLAFLLALPVVLWALPADYFDEGQSVCVSRLLLDVACYACGLTRAVMHLMHFDVQTAFFFNPLVFVVMPLLIWLWAKWLLQDIRALGLISPRAPEPSPGTE